MNEQIEKDLKDRPQIGVGVLFARANKVFLAKRQGSHGALSWGFAGGHLELGESLEQCARREAFEELGVSISNISFLCVSNVIEYGRHYVDIEFLGEIGNQEPVLMEPRSFSSIGWFDVNELPSPLFRPAEYAIDSYLTGQTYHHGA